MAASSDIAVGTVVALPVEHYSDLRIAEFGADENELADFFAAQAALGQATLENEPPIDIVK